MRKILLLLFIFLSLINPVLAENTTHKFYPALSMDGYFDLSTFKADIGSNYSIDVLWNIYSGGDDIISSPYKEDENDIYYIIVRIINVGNQKYLTYKGFVTGEYLQCEDGYEFGNAKIYYDSDESNIPALNIWMDNIIETTKSPVYNEEIMKIKHAYYNDKLNDMKLENF